MRLVSLAALLVALPCFGAAAADYGLPPVPSAEEPIQDVFNWGGIYGGVHVDYGNADYRFEDTLQPLVQQAYYASVGYDLAASFARYNDNASQSGVGYGGFIGFNWVWEDVVIGLEGDFVFFSDMKSQTIMSPDSRYQIVGTRRDDVYSSAAATASVDGVGMLKLRGGVPFGSFMPFATVGLAVGKQSVAASFASIYRESTVDSTGAITSVNVISPKYADMKKDGYSLGWTAGVGVDWAITNNLFLRAEYQYIGLSAMEGIDTKINLVRAGIGLKY